MIYIANGLRRFMTGIVIPRITQTKKGVRPNDRDEFIVNKKVDSKVLLHQYESEEVDLYDDYMELVIEFGFLTLFAESFILAPIAILILNRLEKYSDLTRFQYKVRRPEFVRKRNIGMWQHILQVQSVIAIFTNLSLTLMVSNDNENVKYLQSFLRSSKTNKLSFKLTFFVVEHGIIILLVLLWALKSPVANWVKLFLQRRENKLKSNKWKVLIEDLEISSKIKESEKGKQNVDISNTSKVQEKSKIDKRMIKI